MGLTEPPQAFASDEMEDPVERGQRPETATSRLQSIMRKKSEAPVEKRPTRTAPRTDDPTGKEEIPVEKVLKKLRSREEESEWEETESGREKWKTTKDVTTRKSKTFTGEEWQRIQQSDEFRSAKAKLSRAARQAELSSLQRRAVSSQLLSLLKFGWDPKTGLESLKKIDKEKQPELYFVAKKLMEKVPGAFK